MSEPTEQIDTGRGRTLSIYAWIIVPAVLLVGLLVMTLFRGRGSEDGPKDDRTKTNQTQENHLATVRNALAKHTDLSTCRTAVAQLNNHLLKTRPVDPLPAARTNPLKSALGLDDGDLAELNEELFTSLDAFHLDMCFLLRDAARSLEVVAPAVRGTKAAAPSSLDRGRAAFDWICRQIRLAPSIDPMPAPPDFVLRRGTGSALERGLAFVALLEQIGLQDEKAGLQGCLLFLPGEDSKPALWACGVVPASEPESMYLFDPRLGLALPGPLGKEIATLKQVRDDPAVLGQLKCDKLAYDRTSEQIKSAEALVYAPLTALSPRMRLLQDRLLRDRESEGKTMPAAIRVKLAEEEPGALAAVRKAFEAAGGKGEAVKYWRDGGALLRQFIPKEEGGSDTGVQFQVAILKGFTVEKDTLVARMPRRNLQQLASVPWEDFPPIFRDPTDFRFDLGVGRDIRLTFAAPFVRWQIESGSPRDLIIRGQMHQLHSALPELSREQEYWQQVKLRRVEPEKTLPGVRDWLIKAFELDAAQVRAGGPGKDATVDAQRAALWRWQKDSPMDIMMSSAIADARGADVTFQLALCKHEQAARMQMRLDLAARGGAKNEAEQTKASQAWDQCVEWWKQYLDSYARRPAAPTVRRLLGEAQRGQGQREAAVATWSDTTGIANDLEKLAMLWLAKQAK